METPWAPERVHYFFKSPRYVICVSTLRGQMGLSSEPVDWYRDATSVRYCHLLIDLSLRTDDRLRFCTNTWSFPSNFYMTEWLKQKKSLDDEHTKFFYPSTVPKFFPQMQKSFPSILSKRVGPVSLRMHSKSFQKKPERHKKTSRDKISKPTSILQLKKHLKKDYSP